MADDTPRDPAVPTLAAAPNTISLGPLGQQNPWMVIVLAMLGVGGGSTALSNAFGLDTSEFARAEDVKRVEAKVDRIDGKLESANARMVELRILIATLTAQPEQDQ